MQWPRNRGTQGPGLHNMMKCVEMEEGWRRKRKGEKEGSSRRRVRRRWRADFSRRG